MKLDYSMKGDTEHRKHDKRSESYIVRRPGLSYRTSSLNQRASTSKQSQLPFVVPYAHLRVRTCVLTEVKKEAEEGDEPRAETESESEEELSCFAPTVQYSEQKHAPIFTCACSLIPSANNSCVGSIVCFFCLFSFDKSKNQPL